MQIKASHCRSYWGNRNSQPWLADTVARMAADGVTNALVLATSATGGYSGCRQYRENLRDARLSVPGAPSLVKLRHFFNHPGFIAANADRVLTALASLPEPDAARLVFTAHSVPLSMNDTAGPDGGLYLAQQAETARLVAEAVRGAGAPYDLVWQSRSGPPQVPWLEPDVNDHLRKPRRRGCLVGGHRTDRLRVRPPRSAVGPGQRGAETAAAVGITMARAGTVGTHPAFVQAICDLVRERTDGATPQAVGPMGPSWDECRSTAGCCRAPTR